MPIKLTFERGQFLGSCAFEDRNIFKDVGFYWEPTLRKWFTTREGVAVRLRQYADESARKQIDRVRITNEPWAGRLVYPKTEKPYSFQEDAALFSLARNRSYLGLDPGLGKTVCAAMVANSLARDVVYICPPFLIPNVEEEFARWRYPGKLLLIPDSMLFVPQVVNRIALFAKARSPILIVDEAHRYKNPTSMRTEALLGSEKENTLGHVEHFDKIIYMSGTPMPNRPMELFPILNRSAPQTIGHMKKFDYGRYFCAGFRKEFGWNFDGASNMKQLAAQVHGTFMLRLKKADVLKELPPKTEELLLIGQKLPAQVERLDQALLHKFSPQDLMGHLAPNGHISTYRKELGKVKVQYAVEYLRDLLTETEECILVFAHHKEVIAGLAAKLAEFNPLVIDGDVPPSERQAIAKEFQREGSTHRIFLLNTIAGGIGFNLTKATRVLHVEPSWVPSDNDQASDRAHRIGQTDNVYVQYLVFKNSLDRKVMDAVLRKRKIISHM